VNRPPVTALRIPLPGRLRERAAADAARRGLDLRAWAAQTLEAHLAGCSCSHTGPAAEPSAPAEPAAGD
jgi:hypothetical protein